MRSKRTSQRGRIPNNKTKISVPILDTGTQEAFLIHVQQAKSTCKRKGRFWDYDGSIEVESKKVEQAKSL
jgi:hypothetical protein